MAFSFYDNASSASSLSATQSSILGDMSGSYADIPGCSLSLPAGTWLVIATFHYRCWQTGTGYAKTGHTMAITDGSNNIINGAAYYDTVDAGAEQNSTSMNTLTTTVTLGSTTTVKMRGASGMIAGTNFASGFRWDSGVGGPGRLQAVRLGAA